MNVFSRTIAYGSIVVLLSSMVSGVSFAQYTTTRPAQVANQATEAESTEFMEYLAMFGSGYGQSESGAVNLGFGENEFFNSAETDGDLGGSEIVDLYEAMYEDVESAQEMNLLEDIFGSVVMLDEGENDEYLAMFGSEYGQSEGATLDLGGDTDNVFNSADLRDASELVENYDSMYNEGELIVEGNVLDETLLIDENNLDEESLLMRSENEQLRETILTLQLRVSDLEEGADEVDQVDDLLFNSAGIQLPEILPKTGAAV